MSDTNPSLFYNSVLGGCCELFKLIIRKFTWKSKYTFVSYDDKPNHEIEINPELFCVFVSCSYACCSLPSCGEDYLALVNTRLEKLNNEALMKMLTDNDACLIEFLLRNLTFIATKVFTPTIGKLLPMHPNEAHKEFLISTSWSTQLIIDYLISDETRFLEYFIKFLKYHEQNCNLVQLTNQSCCFASHFDELQHKLTKMSGKKLIPYNIDPLLNRLAKVLTVCMKQESSPVLADNNQWLDSQADITAVNIKDDQSLQSSVMRGGDNHRLTSEEKAATYPHIQASDPTTSMIPVVQNSATVSDFSDALSSFGSSLLAPGNMNQNYNYQSTYQSADVDASKSRSDYMQQSSSQQEQNSSQVNADGQSTSTTLPSSSLNEGPC